MYDLPKLISDLKIKYPDIRIFYEEDMCNKKVKLTMIKNKKVVDKEILMFDLIYPNNYDTKLQLIIKIIESVEWSENKNE